MNTLEISKTAKDQICWNTSDNMIKLFGFFFFRQIYNPIVAWIKNSGLKINFHNLNLNYFIKKIFRKTFIFDFRYVKTQYQFMQHFRKHGPVTSQKSFLLVTAHQEVPSAPLSGHVSKLNNSKYYQTSKFRNQYLIKIFKTSQH